MVVPPDLLRALEADPAERVRNAALRTHATHLPAHQPPHVAQRAAPHHAHAKHRLVYDCESRTTIPGRLARRENDPDTGDDEVDRAYHAAGLTHDFFATVFGRDSIDNRGMHLIASVRYDKAWDNARWDGAQIVYGTGDGTFFASFTTCLDVMAHELVHGVTQSDAGLEYLGESGALNESLSDVFGVLVKQWSLHQTAHDADWLFGTGQILNHPHAALRSLKAPGSAYELPHSRDRQVAHMRDYVTGLSLEEEVHINSGIPNHAFYCFATSLGGHAWETAGRIWYDAMRSHLHPRCEFALFARATLHAAQPHGHHTVEALRTAWHAVGVDTPAPLRQEIAYPG